MSTDTHNDEIARALVGIRSRLDTLASITAENILIPGGPQERYHGVPTFFPPKIPACILDLVVKVPE
jgi:hypothetical protein